MIKLEFADCLKISPYTTVLDVVFVQLSYVLYVKCKYGSVVYEFICCFFNLRLETLNSKTC